MSLLKPGISEVFRDTNGNVYISTASMDPEYHAQKLGEELRALGITHVKTGVGNLSDVEQDSIGGMVRASFAVISAADAPKVERQWQLVAGERPVLDRAIQNAPAVRALESRARG